MSLALAPPYARPRPAVDTGIPGLSRRRVWTAPNLVSHSAVVLTLSKLYLGPRIEPLPKPDLATRLEFALDIPEVLGPLATEIPLASVRKVKHQLAENRLVIEYQTAGHPACAVMQFASSEVADAVFSKLWRRLGETVELVPYRDDPWDLARVPVAFLAGILAGTGMLAITLNAMADGVPLPIAFPSWLDWSGVCGLGGAALAIVQVWLYRRLTCPPTRLVLARRTDHLAG